MTSSSFTTTMLVDQSPMAVFDAINRPREWWGREIEGSTDVLGEEWTYRYKNMHFSRHRTTELVPGRKVVWHVLDSEMNFLEDKGEWRGTDLVFEIERNGDRTQLRFTHAGLVPEIECFGVCSDAWSGLIQDGLKALVETGHGLPPTPQQPGRRSGA